MKRTSRKRKSKRKADLKNVESINAFEKSEDFEDLSSCEVERDCFMEGDFDADSIISRRKLF